MLSLRNCNVPVTLVAAALLAATAPNASAQDSSSNLVYQVQELLEEVRELRGMVESQQRELENLRRRQRDQYLDLDQRLQSAQQPAGSAGQETAPREESGRIDIEGPAPIPSEREREDRIDVPEVRAPIDSQPEVRPLSSGALDSPRDLGTPTEEEQAKYDRAFRALRETRYADAAEGFADFLDAYPGSAYAPNALYWLAESYYVTRDFETALSFFDELLETYPGSNKEGDALLKIGFSYYELEQWNEARAALEQVRSQHAGTTLARLAESRLRDMRLAGHY